MPTILFIHGLGNKPEEKYLFELWKRKLAFDNGIDCDNLQVDTSMCYWAEALYSSPDTNIAAYESATEAVQEMTSLKAAAFPEDISNDPKVRSLAIAIGVDPDNLRMVEPAQEEVAAVQHERVPVPAWLRKRLMARFVRDAYLYFHNEDFSPRTGARYRIRDELRGRFMDKLRASPGNGPRVVVSHSMGTIIAYDCLMHEPECPVIHGFLTVGSPLGLDEVQDFFPGWSKHDGFPSVKLNGPWVNIYDPLDPVVGLDPLFANDYKKNGQRIIEDIREDNWGTWRHSISKYLQGKLLRQHLSRMLKVQWP